MKYRQIRPEKDDYCFPASMQMIFDRRGISPLSQDEIFERFKKRGGMAGIDGEEEFNEFLSGFGLRCELNRPKHNFIEYDIFVRDALNKENDVLAGFDSKLLYGLENGKGHCALVESMIPKTFDLADPSYGRNSVDEYALVRSMVNDDSGFYAIFQI